MADGFSAQGERRTYTGRYSYNGAATTTVLFPRLNIQTGSDAAASGTVHGFNSGFDLKASHLKRLSLNITGTWGVSTIFLMTSPKMDTAYTMAAILHTDSFTVGQNQVDFSRSGVSVTKLWQVDVSGGPSFVDETTDSFSMALGDVTLFPATEEEGIDYAAIGYTSPYGSLSWSSIGGTAGTVGTSVLEYWNGTTWFALSGVVDGTNSFKAALSHGQVMSWTIPSDWVAHTINGTLAYYIRARCTLAYTVNPVYSHVYVPNIPHTIPLGYCFALGFLPNGTANHGDHRGFIVLEEDL